MPIVNTSKEPPVYSHMITRMWYIVGPHTACGRMPGKVPTYLLVSSGGLDLYIALLEPDPLPSMWLKHLPACQNMCTWMQRSFYELVSLDIWHSCICDMGHIDAQILMVFEDMLQSWYYRVTWMSFASGKPCMQNSFNVLTLLFNLRQHV